MSEPSTDEIILVDQALGSLVAALTCEPTAAELAGQQAALAMFRAARQADRLAELRRHRVRRGRKLAAATTAAVLAVGVAAGYALLTSPLPGMIGRLFSGSGHGPAPAGHSHRGPTSPGTPSASPPSLYGNSASQLATRLVAAGPSVRRIPVGGSLVITAVLTYHRETVPNSPLSLLERTPTQRHWQLATSARTGKDGTADLIVPGVTANAEFKVTGPNKLKSHRVTVIVLLPVTVRQVTGTHGGPGFLLVSCPYGWRADVVRLQQRSQPAWSPDGWPRRGRPASDRRPGQRQPTWHIVRAGRLGKGGQVSFAITFHDVGSTFRVVLLASREHGQSISNQVVVVLPGSLGMW